MALEHPAPSELRRLARVASMADSMLGDEYAAAHYRVFVHEAMPVASLYLEASGMPGGDLTGRARQAYDEDVRSLDPSLPADHIAQMLEMAASRAEQDPATALAWLAEWVTPWAGLCTAAITRMQVHPVITAWASDLDAVLARVPAGSDARPVTVLPPAEHILDEPSTNLADIGRYLSLPARSGLFLTLTDIQAASRRFHVPTGFGSRSRGIEGLLRSASTYDVLEEVCRELALHVENTRALWDAPRISPHWVSAWTSRLDATDLLLDRMVSAVAERE